MASGKGVDLLMKFRISGDNYVSAESTDSLGNESSSSALSARLDLNGPNKDLFLKGFKKNKIFEIADFKFGAGVQLGSGSESEAAAKAALEEATRTGNKELVKLLSAQVKAYGRKKAQSWTFGGTYTAEMDPVSFTRSIDQASSSLLQQCYDSSYFESVTLVKRRSGGGTVSGYGYLRLDFGGVMINEIDWSEDDEVREEVTFVYRSVLIQYRAALPSGDLGSPVKGSWQMPLVKEATFE